MANWKRRKPRDLSRKSEWRTWALMRRVFRQSKGALVPARTGKSRPANEEKEVS